MKLIYDDVKARNLRSSYLDVQAFEKSLEEEAFTGYIHVKQTDRIIAYIYGKPLNDEPISKLDEPWEADIFFLNYNALVLMKYFDKAEHRETLVLAPKIIHSLIRSEKEAHTSVWIEISSKEATYDILVMEGKVFFYRNGRRVDNVELKEKAKVSTYDFSDIMEDELRSILYLEVPARIWNIYKDKVIEKLGKEEVLERFSSSKSSLINPLSGLFSFDDQLNISIETYISVPEVVDFRNFILKLIQEAGYEVL